MTVMGLGVSSKEKQIVDREEIKKKRKITK